MDQSERIVGARRRGYAVGRDGEGDAARGCCKGACCKGACCKASFSILGLRLLIQTIVGIELHFVQRFFERFNLARPRCDMARFSLPVDPQIVGQFIGQ